MFRIHQGCFERDTFRCISKDKDLQSTANFKSPKSEIFRIATNFYKARRNICSQT